MARPGTPSRVGADPGGRGAATRQALVEAAVETLKADGFAGASARAIAARAGCNQALVFYHFGTVAGLLLAALDAVSAARLERYAAVVEAARTPAELVEAAAAIFAEDLDAGHVTVLVEMIAGASSTPGLGAQVAARLEPWNRFAEEAVARLVGGSPIGALIPAGQVAYGLVAFYLGSELLSHLDGDRRPALELFDRVRRLVEALPTPG